MSKHLIVYNTDNDQYSMHTVEDDYTWTRYFTEEDNSSVAWRTNPNNLLTLGRYYDMTRESAYKTIQDWMQDTNCTIALVLDKLPTNFDDYPEIFI